VSEIGWFSRLERWFEAWKRGGYASMTYDLRDETLTFRYPHPDIRKRRRMLLAILSHPFTITLTATVIAGAILKAFGWA